MERTIGFYMELYSKDARIERYVQACMAQEKRPLVEMMQLKAIRLTGDYYAENPPREVPTVTTTNCGCGGC